MFSPDLKEFYFTLNRNEFIEPKTEKFRATVIGIRMENNIWKKYIEFKRKGEVTFSSDGNRMHMAKGYKDRVGNGWSELKTLDTMFNRKDWGDNASISF